jgi:hypothetical protein
LLLDDDGKPKAVQQIDIPGWIWGGPPASGSVIWAAGDKGGIEAYALGDYLSKKPLTSLARLAPDAATSGPAFGLATSERELWVAAGRSGRYELDPERGEITPRSALGQPGSALGPLQEAARRVVLTFQDPVTGGTSLFGVDPTAGTISWQTILGAPWPTPLSLAQGGDGLQTLGRTGTDALISPAQLERGGFITLPLSRPGAVQVPTGRVLTIEGGGPGTTVITSGAGSNAVWTRETGKTGAWRKLELPTALAAMPLVWDRSLLVPGADGRAYMIDPLTAKSTAEPFVPVYSRDLRGRWLAPARLDRAAAVLADDVGRVRRLVLKQDPGARLVAEPELTLDKPIIADPAATGEAVIVATIDQKVRVLSGRDLSPLGAWPLEAPLVGRPVVAGQFAFVFDAAGGVLAISREGRRLWSIKLGAVAAGDPVIDGDRVWLLDRTGRLEGRSLASGARGQSFDLGVLPAGGLVLAGSKTIVPVARGSIAPLSIHPDQIQNP